MNDTKFDKRHYPFLSADFGNGTIDPQSFIKIERNHRLQLVE